MGEGEGEQCSRCSVQYRAAQHLIALLVSISEFYSKGVNSLSFLETCVVINVGEHLSSTCLPFLFWGKLSILAHD